DEVTLGVAFSDMHGHQKETVPTTHSFKKILDLACFDQATMTEEIVDPGCNVTMRTKKALHEPVYHLCETAKNVDIKWFALTETYHIVKASVSVLMEDDDLPVLPCVIRNSKYCAEYEVLYKTEDATAFCMAWDTATEGVGYGIALSLSDKPDEENPMIGFRGCGRNTGPFFEECLTMEVEAVKLVRREMGWKNVENMIRFVRTPDMAKDVTEVLEKN
ncbi:ppsA, partial [Symbiodinium pilosum]